MNQSTLPGPIPAPRIVQAPRGSSHQIPPPLRDTQPSSTQPPRRQNLLPQRFTFCAADVRARPVDVGARPVRAMASPHPSPPPPTLSRAPTRLDQFPTSAVASAAAWRLRRSGRAAQGSQSSCGLRVGGLEVKSHEQGCIWQCFAPVDLLLHAIVEGGIGGVGAVLSKRRGWRALLGREEAL